MAAFSCLHFRSSFVSSSSLSSSSSLDPASVAASSSSSSLLINENWQISWGTDSTYSLRPVILNSLLREASGSKDIPAKITKKKIVVKTYLRPCATNPFVNRDSSFWNRKFSVNVLLPVLIKIILELLLHGCFEWLMEKTSSGWIQLVQRQTERHQAPSFSFWEVIALPPFAVLSQPAFNYSKSTIETPEQYVKSVQS